MNKEPGSREESSLPEELESLLKDAVGRQMIADVPVGILLSGGIETSLITAFVVRHSQKVQTFSIGFPGHGKLDETDHARLIAQHFGNQHTELMVEPATADLLPVLAQQFDEPMVDSSMIPTYLVQFPRASTLYSCIRVEMVGMNCLVDTSTIATYYGWKRVGKASWLSRCHLSHVS